jgi:hypothetical protein
MAFRRAAFALSLILAFWCTATAQAGWHHRHCCTYGQPTYYLAQAAPAAVQSSPQRMLIEALLPIVLDVARRRIGGTTSPPIITTQPGGASSWERDLASLRSEVAATTAGVENASAVLRRHGEELANLRLELGDVRGKVDQVGQTVSSAGAIQATLAEIKANQPLKSKKELIQDLTNDALYARVKAQLNLPDEAAKKALLDNLKSEITSVIDSAFGAPR